MSDFMFGGSALTLDVGVRNQTAGAVSQGDIIQIDLTSASEDGFDAVECQSGDTATGNHSVTGAVLAPAGLSIGVGDNCIVRVMGKAKAKAETGAVYAVGEICAPSDGAMTLAASAAPALGAYSAADLKAKAVALEAVGGGGADAGQLIDVWMKGLPL
jgi:hypothetical protein